MFIMSPPNPLSQVTGANKGIGAEIVRQLTAQGLTAIATGRNAALVQASAEAIGRDLGRPVPYHQVGSQPAPATCAPAPWF